MSSSLFKIILSSETDMSEMVHYQAQVMGCNENLGSRVDSRQFDSAEELLETLRQIFPEGQDFTEIMRVLNGREQYSVKDCVPLDKAVLFGWRDPAHQSKA